MKRKYSSDELQNENLYLYAPSNSRVVKEILDEQDNYKWGNSRSKKFFSEAIDEYDNLITLIAKFIKELKLDNNAVMLCVLLRKMILDGYFSVDNKFIARSDAMFYDVNLLNGMDIVAGKGCCRHIAGFYSDVFNKLEMFNYIFKCYYSDNKCSLEEAFSKIANHAANLIKYNDVIYCYNCFNNIMLKSIDGFTMEQISNGDDNKAKFFYKPSACIMTSIISYKDVLNMVKLFEENSKKEAIKYDDYIKIRRDAKNLFYDNKELFNDLKEDAKKYTKKLANDLWNSENEYIDSLYY